jgi:hypothetical protein
MTLSRKHDVLAVLFIVGVITLWFWEVLFAGQSYYTRDIFNYHYPMKWIVRQAILAGELPMWSAYFGSGQPLAANPAYEVFYPMQWLTLLPDFHYGMTLHIVVHFYICAIGLYAFIRSLGAGVMAALLGAFGFALGGPLISLIRTLPFLFAIAWAPVIFLYVRRLLITRSRRDFLLTALFGGIQALVAEPTILLQTWFLVGCYVVYRAIRDRPQLKRDVLAIALAGVAVLIMAAAQLIPMADFVRGTVRAQGIDFDTGVAKWSLPGARVLELFYPQIYQSLFNQAGVRWLSPMYPQGEPFVTNFYIGFAVAIFFVAGIVAWRRGSGLALAAFVTLYVVAIGNGTPLLRILYDLGLFKTMRYPEKFFIGACLVAVIWGALTADRLIKGDERVRKATTYVTLSLFVLGLFLLLAAVSSIPAVWVLNAIRGAALLVMLRQRTAKWAAGLVLLTIVDLAHLRRSNDTITREYFSAPPVTRQLDPNKGQYRVFHRAEWDWLYSVPNADDYFRQARWRWWSLRNSLMPRNGAYFGYQYAFDRDYDETFLLHTTEFLRAMLTLRINNVPGWDEQFMAMSNAWYSGTFRNFRSEAARLGDQHSGIHPVDFQPAAAKYPRYYFADQIETVNGTEDFIEKLSAKRFSPGVAFVEKAFPPASGRVLSVKETRHSIRLDVEAAGRALLVMSVTADRYWRARIDGGETKPIFANIAYQALEVPPGRHTIEMTYRNPLIVPSAVVSLIALVLIVIGVIASPRVNLPLDEPSVAAGPRPAQRAKGPSPHKPRRR